MEPAPIGVGNSTKEIRVNNSLRTSLAAFAIAFAVCNAQSFGQDLELFPIENEKTPAAQLEPVAETVEDAAEQAVDTAKQAVDAVLPVQQAPEPEPQPEPESDSDTEPMLLDPIPIEEAPRKEWTIAIQPALKASAQSTSVACENCDVAKVQQYRKVYDSIPFNRAEYNRNPTYRHDSTMEILTGNARHQTIVRHGSPNTVVYSRSGGNRLANPAQFGYLRPALRLNYYRYFPTLNPYLNIWNLSGAF